MRLRLQCCSEQSIAIYKRSSHPVTLRTRLDHLLWCSEKEKKSSLPPSLWRGDRTYFLFLFLAVSDPVGSSTSMLSSSRRSFRPAAPPAPRLFAVCFSRKRSATSLSAELRASSCSASSRTLTVLCSARVTSFASSVCRTVAVVCDLFFFFFFHNFRQRDPIKTRILQTSFPRKTESL
jgi:hypothetical protein